MRKGVIKIGKPYIEDVSKDKVRLCSHISMNGEEKLLYYEVDMRYKEYLCYSRSDAFLVGLLHTAMFEDMDIECEDVVTEKLLFQLARYYVPIVAENMKDMHGIAIKAPSTSAKLECKNAVVTGLSGGADSFYTLLKYSEEEFGEHKLTHAIFNNIATADVNDESIRKQHNKDVEDKKKIARDLGLEFVELYSNLYEFYRHPGVFNHYFALQYISAILALARLFGVFYFSSSYTLKSFSVNYDKIPSGAPFDLFTLHCTATDTLSIYSAGMEVERYKKMKQIASYPIAQKNLQVCSAYQDFGGPQDIKKLNCGKCMKCSRAILTLDLFGLLDHYEDAIDLTLYKENVNKFTGRYLAGDKGVFSVDVLNELKAKKRYSISVKIWRILFRIRFKLAKNDVLVKIVDKIKNTRK